MTKCNNYIKEFSHDKKEYNKQLDEIRKMVQEAPKESPLESDKEDAEIEVFNESANGKESMESSFESNTAYQNKDDTKSI